VDEVLRSKTRELIPLAQLEDAIDGRANGLKTLFDGSIKRLSRQNFLHIDLERHAARAPPPPTGQEPLR
jgi:hypothetical protein